MKSEFRFKKTAVFLLAAALICTVLAAFLPYIDPSIPTDWDGFTVKRTYRGRKLTIRVDNPCHVQHGVKELYVDGKQILGDGKAVLTMDMLNSCEEAQIRVVMMQET